MGEPYRLLNLGCGKDIRPGWTNMDRNAFPGVDIVHDLCEVPWPFADGFFDHILASHVLEHVVDFASVWREIGRVLKSGGTIEVRVPKGFNTDPYHVRYFDEWSIERLTSRSGKGCLDDEGATFVEVSRRLRGGTGGFPWWHLEHYIGIRLPYGKFAGEIKRELVFVLRKQ